MKLKNLILYKSYRSLQLFGEESNIGAGERGMFLKHPLLYGRIDPVCLVGENGCGKSNLLELLGDIFFEVDKFFLEEKRIYTATKTSSNYFAYANQEDQMPIYFQLIYEIGEKVEEGKKISDGNLIKIERKENDKLRFYKWGNIDQKSNLFNNENEIYDFVELDTSTLEKCRYIRDNYIPLVVAYTSGLNDLLTLPFIDTQDYYAQQVAKEALSTINTTEKISSPNLLLLNYDSNASIVVSNFLLATEAKCNVFKEMLRIERMNSFRIVIRLNKLAGNKKVKLTQELQGYIDKLRKCAALVMIDSTEEKGLEYTFDFIVNEVTKELFKKHFTNVQELFYALTKLNLLNTLCIRGNYRDELKKKRKQGRLVKFPQVATLDKIFSIEKIELVLNKPQVRTEYEKISDGEHQFIHIIGGIMLFDKIDAEKDILYLLDEPDTHFNPLWRSNFFYQLETVLEKKNVEFVVTTHSPFILSDCHAYNTFKFTRHEHEVKFERIDKEIYGSSYENVAEILFTTTNPSYEHFNHHKAKNAYLALEKLYNRINEVNEADAWIKQRQSFLKEINMFGESLDKNYTLQKYIEKEEKFNPKNA